ncbi:hypothetical protein [Blastopirellula marina]|uniref:Knr4/Smi1-like domain-containing protein n=1 Tax=Blastopirellula marina TaxID=124 RepID=A0A2S8GMX3_9BACT|nr:hypothetical protein [Blastopirellula marina]PQO45769.1 hypothetical protein C5Y93_12645 [Blastopirellula marina]
MKWPEGLTAYAESPATEAEIAALVESVSAPLTELGIAELQAERRAIAGDVGFDPASWPFPGRPLPDSYLAFLRYSNGGFFSGLHRNCDLLFKTDEVREYMLGYDIPRWKPGLRGCDNARRFLCGTNRNPARTAMIRQKCGNSPRGV